MRFTANKRLTLILVLVLLSALFSTAQAYTPDVIADFSIFAPGQFRQVAQEDFGAAILQTYEAPYTCENKAQLQRILDDYRSWFDENPLLDCGGEHHADFGRFGDYTQEAVWYYFNDLSTLGAFSMDLVDQQVEYCHVLLAFKEYEDKFGLDLYFSPGMGMESAESDQLTIPWMETFIRPAVISTENLSGATVFQIADEDASAILDYLAILEEYGLGEITYSDEDAGYPLYIWAESCQKNLEPEKANVYGLEVEYYVMILMDYDGEYYYVTPFYADSMNPQNTGDTWNGVPLEASDAEEPEAENAPPAREEEKKF